MHTVAVIGAGKIGEVLLSGLLVLLGTAADSTATPFAMRSRAGFPAPMTASCFLNTVKPKP